MSIRLTFIRDEEYKNYLISYLKHEEKEIYYSVIHIHSLKLLPAQKYIDDIDSLEELVSLSEEYVDSLEDNKEKK